MTVGVEEGQRRIHALVRVGRAMASTADYEQALATLIETVSQLLGVETGGFMVYDPQRDELVLQQPAFGFADPGLISEYHVPLSGGGNAVRVFLSRTPYMTNDARQDPRMIRRFIDLFGARTVLTVPLVVEETPIGVFHAINKREGPFTQGDLEFLTLLAPLLAVSVQSAGMFREVREQRRQLERAVFLQKELSHTALDAPGMDSLAVRLADLLGRPVMVLDPALSPLASSRWPDDLPPCAAWLGRVPGAGKQPSAPSPVLTPIAVGSHFGGHLAVLEAGVPLDLIDIRAIEHAATIFALEMLREQSAYEVEARLKANLLEDLSSRTFATDEEAQALLRRLGYTVAGPCRAGRVEAEEKAVGPSRWQEQLQGSQSRLYTAVSEACRKVLGVAAVAPWRSGFVLLLPASTENPDADPELASQLLTRVRGVAERIHPGLHLRLCLGSPVDPTRALAQSLEESERALAVARTLGIADRPLFFEHLGVYRVLLGPNTARDRLDFVKAALGSLTAYDAEHGTDLLGTLRAWVTADYRIVEAAQQLFIHTQTMKYRLRRIRQLLGADPSRGELRLQVELALKMLDLPRLAGST